jgi:hypothetical protein
MTVHAEAVAEVERAIAELWEQGCPVAGHPQEMAAIAIRRWFSSARRGIDQQDLQARINDLVKGLIARCEAHPEHVGRIRRDYECIAEASARVLQSIVAGSKDGLPGA